MKHWNYVGCREHVPDHGSSSARYPEMWPASRNAACVWHGWLACLARDVNAHRPHSLVQYYNVIYIYIYIYICGSDERVERNAITQRNRNMCMAAMDASKHRNVQCNVEASQSNTHARDKVRQVNTYYNVWSSYNAHTHTHIMSHMINTRTCMG